MSRSSAIICSAACLLAAATPAYADRDGDGAVRTPRIVHSTHTEFTLPGAGWTQVVGAMGGTPVIGDYAVDLVLPGAIPCRVSVAVDTKTQGVYPSVGRRTVRTHPLSRGLLRYSRTGREGAVRWWSGTSDSLDAAAAAVQRTPAELRTKHRRFLLTWVSVSHTAAPADDDACRARARSTGARTVLRVVRSLTLANGPAVSEAPLTPA
jgi:hypothetical protein